MLPQSGARAQETEEEAAGMVVEEPVGAGAKVVVEAADNRGRKVTVEKDTRMVHPRPAA